MNIKNVVVILVIGIFVGFISTYSYYKNDSVVNTQNIEIYKNQQKLFKGKIDSMNVVLDSLRGESNKVDTIIEYKRIKMVTEIDSVYGLSDSSQVNFFKNYIDQNYEITK